MKTKAMKVKQTMFKKYPGMLLVILLLMLCASCGAKLIRGESPMVRISEVSHKDDIVSLQLSIRNINGEPLDIQEMELTVTTENQQLFAFSGPVTINIVANGTETWSVDLAESSVTREKLDAVQNGEINSLPYDLDGSIRTLDTGSLRFEHKGHLYTLPGRPGHFR
jgi:outer membrane lipoprotein-sorting protein